MALLAAAVTARLDFSTGKDACRNGGWKTSPSPHFGNQGECVSYFAAGK